MRWIRALLENEAVVAVGVLTAVANLAMAFGFDLTAEQVASINSLVIAVGALLARALVWSESSVDDVRSDAYLDGLAERSRVASALRDRIDGHDAR